MKTSQKTKSECPTDGVAAAWAAAIVDSTNEAIFSTDLQGRVVTWNKAAERMFGYSAAEVIGQPVSDTIVPPEKMEEEAAFLGSLKRGESVKDFQTLRRHRNGRLIEVSLTLSPILLDGQLVGASVVARDSAAEAARRRNLTGAITELESYTHHVSVGVRGPVRVLRGFIHLVLDDYAAAMPPEGRALLERASNAADRLAVLVEKSTE